MFLAKYGTYWSDHSLLGLSATFSLYGTPNVTKLVYFVSWIVSRSPGPQRDLWDRSTILRTHTRILESVPEIDPEINSEIDPEIDPEIDLGNDIKNAPRIILPNDLKNVPGNIS